MERLALLAWVLVLLAGCSVVSTVYTRLDALAVMQAREWLDLDREQSGRFRERVRLRMQEHRAPLLATTLAEMRPVQIEHLGRAFDRSNAEYHREFLAASPQRRDAERRNSLRRGVERWSGRLEPAQRAILDRLAQEFVDGSADWYAHRLRWQAGLLELLHDGADAGLIEAYVVRWWADGSEFDQQYATRMQGNEQLAAQRMAELINTLEPAQRARAAGRLRSLAGELYALHRAGEPPLELAGLRAVAGGRSR